MLNHKMKIVNFASSVKRSNEFNFKIRAECYRSDLCFILVVSNPCAYKRKKRTQDSPALLLEVCEPIQVHWQGPKNNELQSGQHDQNLWSHQFSAGVCQV